MILLSAVVALFGKVLVEESLWLALLYAERQNDQLAGAAECPAPLKGVYFPEKDLDFHSVDSCSG